MVSIRDISKHTGLSIGTISRYINKSGYVSEKSGEKIEAAIKALDYVPNEHARALFSKETKLIGVIVSSLSNPFFAELTMYLEQNAKEYGYGIILFTSDDDEEKESEALRSLKAYRVSGIITTRTQLRKELEELNIPIITFEDNSCSNVISVSADNYLGGQLAFRHLYEKGCKKILHIKGPSQFYATEMRYEGFIHEAEKYGVNVDVHEFLTDYKLDYDLKQMIKDIDLSSYDGIFAFNDIAATLVLSYMQHIGIRVPEDVKLIGFDNSYISGLVNPKLTTIEQSAKDIGFKCIELLMNNIKGEDVSQKEHLVPITLIEREST